MLAYVGFQKERPNLCTFHNENKYKQHDIFVLYLLDMI